MYLCICRGHRTYDVSVCMCVCVCAAARVDKKGEESVLTPGPAYLPFFEVQSTTAYMYV